MPHKLLCQRTLVFHHRTLGVLSLALLLLPGCLHEQKSDSGTPGNTPQTVGPAAGTAAGSKRFKIGFAQANSQDPYRQVQNASLIAAAQKFADIDFTMSDAHQDSNTQIGQIDNFLTNKVDLLMVSPNEAAPLTPKVGEVYDKKIPILLMERGINSDKYTTLLGGDNVQIGRMAGEFLVQKLNGKGAYVEIKGIADATPTKDRSSGFHSVVDKATGLKRVADYVCNYKRDEAITYMANLLQKKTPFDAVYAHNDEMALGALIAMKNAGIDPKTKVIIGIDGVQEEAIRAILNGEMSATFKYPWLGEEAMQAAHDLLTGKTQPKRITPPTERITNDNAQDYLTRLPKAK